MNSRLFAGGNKAIIIISSTTWQPYKSKEPYFPLFETAAVCRGKKKEEENAAAVFICVFSSLCLLLYYRIRENRSGRPLPSLWTRSFRSEENVL